MLKQAVLIPFMLFNIQCYSYYYYFNGWVVPDEKMEDFAEYKVGLKANTSKLVDFDNLTRSVDIDQKVNRIAFDSFAEHVEGLVKVEHSLLDYDQIFIPISKLNKSELAQFNKLKQVEVPNGK